jgi:hypothetical protein
MIPLRLYLYAAAVLAIVGALWGYGHYQKQQGRAEVQSKFDAYIAKQTAETLQASLANQETSLLKQKAVDRSRQNDFENAKKLAAANARLNGTVAGLHDTIAALNNRPKAGDATEASTRAYAAAKIARELLGECASRYSEVAGEAGELAKQVIGLQGFIEAAIREESREESAKHSALVEPRHL